MSNRDTTRDCRSSESGTALLGAMLMAITILGLTAAALTSGIATNDQARYLTAGHKANAAAEAGVTHLVAAMGSSQRDAVLVAGELKGTVRGTEASERAIRYEVTITSGAADGIDNDLDGLVDESGEDEYYEVSSTGRADNVARTLRVTLSPRFSPVYFPHAVMMKDPNTEFRLEDNISVLWSGRDVDLDGNETGLLVPGIAVVGDPSNVLSKIAPAYNTKVIGLGGDRSVHQVDNKDYLTDMMDGVVSYPDIRIEGGGTYSGEFWGTVANPKRIHIKDDFRIEGVHVKGAGILVIDDRLRLEGGATLEWTGILVVRGEFRNRDSTVKVTGGMLLPDNDFDRLRFESATTIIQYSAEAIRMTTLTKSLTLFVALNWRLVANPKE